MRKPTFALRQYICDFFKKEIKPVLAEDLKYVEENAPLGDILEQAGNLLQPSFPEMPGPDQTWENTLGNVTEHPELCFYPKSIHELVSIITKAEAENHRVRAVGSGHSFCDVAATSDYLVFTHGLNRVLKNSKGFPDGLILEKKQLKNDALYNHLFETEAGITLHSLNDILYKNDVALSTMGSFDAQTFIGAASTATHGTGIKVGSFPSIIRSLVLVTTGGKKYRIEPADGITDPAKYNVPDIPLVQDDDWFYSLTVSMGCMGIIYSVVFDVVDTYWLREEKSFKSWETVRADLIAGKSINLNRHYEIQVNPYKVDGLRSCVELRQNIIPKPACIFDHGHRNYLSALFDLFPDSAHLVLAYLNLFPKKTPETINSALKKLVDTYENVSYKILYEGFPHLKKLGYACEYGFPVEGNKYLDAVDKIFEVADNLRVQKNHFINSPLSLRFVKGGNAYMAMDYGPNTATCMIDVPLLYGTRGGDESLDAFQEALTAMGGRPHWGKINDKLNNQQIMQAYPRYSKWKNVFDQLNPQRTFTSPFTQRCGF